MFREIGGVRLRINAGAAFAARENTREGMLVAIVVPFTSGKRSALLEATAFGLGGLIVFAALDGAWVWANFKVYGNPIFPLMNNVFQSDLITPDDWTDRRFLPGTTAAALFYPTYWAFRRSTDVSVRSSPTPLSTN